MDNNTCDYCDGGKPFQAYETGGRGWKFLCEACYDGASGIIQSYCEAFVPGHPYPRYNYDTRKIEVPKPKSLSAAHYIRMTDGVRGRKAPARRLVAKRRTR
jgi:hypothetical protein